MTFKLNENKSIQVQGGGVVLRKQLRRVGHVGTVTTDLSAYDSCQSVEAFDLCSVLILIIALNDTLQTSPALQV